MFERTSSRFTKNGLTGKVKIVPVLEGANPQLGSPFLTRLPLDVRSMIYSHLLWFWGLRCLKCSYTPSPDLRAIHLRNTTTSGRNLSGEPCLYETNTLTCRSWRDCSSWRCSCDLFYHTGTRSLLLTCRMLYHEYLPRMYERYRFIIPSIHIWETFALGMVQHQQFTHGALQSLRHIYLDIGPLCQLGGPQCTKLSSCFKLLTSRAVSLTDLRISMVPVHGREGTTMLGRELLRDLVSLRGLSTFQLEFIVPWRLTSLWTNPAVGGTGFTITRESFERRAAALQRVIRAVVTLPRGTRVPKRTLDAMLSIEALAGDEDDLNGELEEHESHESKVEHSTQN